MPSTARLFVADLHGSVLHPAETTLLKPAYTPFGFSSRRGPECPAVRFNGQYHEPLSGHYLLGNGYRLFNPVLMRFTSPDSLSPFGEGGFNSYGYCQGDPINRVDPSGHFDLTGIIVCPSRIPGRRLASEVFVPPLGMSFDDAARLYVGAGFAEALVARTHKVASKRVGRDAGVKTIKRVTQIEGLATAEADFANALLAKSKTPYLGINEFAENGTSYQQVLAESLLSKIWKKPYAEAPPLERKLLARAVELQLGSRAYPDQWYSNRDLRRAL